MTESKHDHAIPKLNGFLLWSPKWFGFQHSPKNLILCSLEESLEERKSRRKSRNSAILLSITLFKLTFSNQSHMHLLLASPQKIQKLQWWVSK